MDALEKYDLENDEEVSKPNFEITDLSSATWAMRKYRALAAKDDELKKVALEQKESINAWLESKLQANQDSRAFFEGLFADYLTKLRKDDPKARIETPFGTVSTRKTPTGVNWSDETVVQSLEKQGLNDLINIKKTPDKKQIKKQFYFVKGRYVNDEGQIIDGASEKESVENLIVKPTKEI